MHDALPLVRSVCRTVLPALLGCALAAPAAWAHDTWFSRQASPGAPLGLALSTGTRYPQRQFNPTAASLQQAACRTAGGRRLALTPTTEAADHLRLQTQVPAQAGGLSCWAELHPFNVELKPDIVAVYFAEIHPPEAVRQAWAEMQARGVTWQERYTKYARIDLASAAPGGPPGLAGDGLPTGLAMDILLDRSAPLRPRGEVRFQVLRLGKPLPNFAVELVSDQLRYGRWVTTDDEGRATVTVPFAGGWLLRGTDLYPSPDQPDRWESRFVTLAFEVAR